MDQLINLFSFQFRKSLIHKIYSHMRHRSFENKIAMEGFLLKPATEELYYLKS